MFRRYVDGFDYGKVGYRHSDAGHNDHENIIYTGIIEYSFPCHGTISRRILTASFLANLNILHIQFTSIAIIVQDVMSLILLSALPSGGICVPFKNPDEAATILSVLLGHPAFTPPTAIWVRFAALVVFGVNPIQRGGGICHVDVPKAVECCLYTVIVQDDNGVDYCIEEQRGIDGEIGGSSAGWNYRGSSILDGTNGGGGSLEISHRAENVPGYERIQSTDISVEEHY